VRLSASRVQAILRKELRDYRRNRQIVVSMAVLPLVFSIYPAVELFALPASASGVLLHTQALVYMLAIPAIVPAVVAAYSVAGERQQDTLEPVLTTPIRAEELLLGKGWRAGGSRPPGRAAPSRRPGQQGRARPPIIPAVTRSLGDAIVEQHQALVGHAGAGEAQVDGQLSHANPPWS
jgi:hypothetical protein